MPKGTVRKKTARTPKGKTGLASLQSVLWRLDRLERQVQRLSELIRDHAEDEDRLVQIVAEDREILRREVLRDQQAHLRTKKQSRVASSKPGLTG